MSGPLPDLEETRRRLTDHDVVAVVLELPIGEATPVAAMRALGTEASCFLLESVVGSGAVAQWSMLGHGPSRVMRDDGSGEDPLATLERDVASAGAACAPGLAAPLLGGAVGFLTYEAAGRYEHLPQADRDPLQLPRQWFAIFDTVAVFDHAQHRLLLSSCVHREDPSGLDAAYARALSRIDTLRDAICSATPVPAAALSGTPVDVRAHDDESNLSRDEFEERVRRSLDYIVAGDIFQVQVSRRFAVPLQADPFDVYIALRAINPSPYMIYIATPECTLVGASPEMLVQVTGQSVHYHPIAGTRRRGRTADDDDRMERELRASEKEAAEHLMLIDLGRNDLGRVCATGSVRVTQHMEVERYSHVMHLVSSIEGTLDEGRNSLDALRSCFPAGTVTGAPKIRAMEIIAELEPEVRGPYAGAIGYVGYGGDLDTAIALRTIVIRDGIAYVQAAAGIVADSSIREETVEIDNKVAAQILAVEEANGWARR
ncbi:MAG: chorismate-binding protein [Candidatus Dormiibacterota bacterium]